MFWPLSHHGGMTCVLGVVLSAAADRFMDVLNRKRFSASKQRGLARDKLGAGCGPTAVPIPGNKTTVQTKVGRWEGQWR